MAKLTKVFLTLIIAIAMVTAAMTLVANAETTTSDTILQKFLVVYNMNETTRITNAETGATGTYFPVHVYTAIDTLKYEEVGIKVTPKYISTGATLGTQTMWTTTVYSTMRVTQRDGTEQVYSAEQLGGSYLFGRELLFNSNNFDALDTEIEIIPYAIDRDGNEILGKTLVLSDEVIKSREPSSGLFHHKTNITPAIETTEEERYIVEKGEIALSELFTAVEGEIIDNSKVKVTVSDDAVVAYTSDTADWTKSILDFNTVGDVDVTIKAGSGATKKLHFTVAEFDKFDKKFTHTDEFIYRVGNANNVSMNSLFAASGEGDINSSKVSVAIENVDGNASGTFTANTSNWINGNIKFSGTGTVKVTVNEGENIPTELYLEVINATNTTGIASATANDVVLLNDVTTSSIINVSNGHTIHGNGFTVTWPNDISTTGYVEGFVQMNSGNLDNIQIKVPDFSFAGLYQYQLLTTKYGNVCDTSRGSNWFFNIRCAILSDGKSSLKNSKVSGGRIAVNARSGEFVFDNSTVIGGAVASVQIGSAKAVTFKDAKLIQQPTSASVHDTSKTLMGFSVLVMAEESGESTPITIEGDFEQYAWICEDYKKYVPGEDTGDTTGIIQGVITKVLLMDDYKHKVSLNGEGTKEWFNLGIAYLPLEIGNTVNVPTINDYRTNKEEVPYSVAAVSVSSTTARVYTYNNSMGTHADTLVMPEFALTSHENMLPVLSYGDTSDVKTFATVFDASNGWASTFTVDLDTTGNYTFDFGELVASRNGTEYDYTIKDSSGNVVTEQTLLLDDSGIYEYIITVNDNKQYGTDGTLQNGESVYTPYTLTIVATKTSIAPPEKISSPSGSAILAAKGYDSDWTIAVPALEGASVKYYSKAAGEYKTLSLADIVPKTKGKQNGTEKFWTKTVENDYTLTITSSYIHEGKQIFGMPVVVNDNGTYKMYFTLSSTTGYVSTKTTSRDCTLTYEFTDANGGSVTFTKQWQLVRADYIDAGGKQYSYSDLVSGTLTELSGGGGSCVAPDTLITLADGTQVRVDVLTGEEELLVWNMETGAFDVAPIMFVDSDPEAEVNIVELVFSDGTTVDVIYEHGFWDYDLNRYVYLDENAAEYIGHTFAKQNGDTLEKVQLVEVNITTESSMAYSPVTVGHLCYIVNGMLSMPGGVGGLFNIFEVDPETMTYDLEAMERDIAEYGLFTYEEMAELVPELPESMFDAAGGKYLKISIGKGNLTEEELEAMIIRYTKFF